MAGEVLIGTSSGLWALGEPAPRIPGIEVRAVEGPWVLDAGRRIVRVDGGAVDVAPVVGPEGRCLLEADGGLLVGTAEARLLRLVGEGLEPIAGFDAVAGRDGWYTPWGGPPDTRSMTRDAAGTLFVNVHVGGIPRSRDGGVTWEPTIDVDADVHQVLAHPSEPGRVFAATALGVAETTDEGETWTFHTEGLHGDYCRAVAIAGDTLIATASEGHVGRRAAVYRRPLAAGPFERCSRGLPEWFSPNIDTHCLAADGDRAAFGTAGGEVYVSSDAGLTWELASEGLPKVTCVTLR